MLRRTRSIRVCVSIIAVMPHMSQSALSCGATEGRIRRKALSLQAKRQAVNDDAIRPA